MILQKKLMELQEAKFNKKARKKATELHKTSEILNYLYVQLEKHNERNEKIFLTKMRTVHSVCIINRHNNHLMWK